MVKSQEMKEKQQNVSHFDKKKTVYIVYQQKERHSSCAKHLKEIVLR